MTSINGENRHPLNLDYGETKSSSAEGTTAKRELLVMAKDLYDLYVALNGNDDLPEWCHYKIASSKSELSAVSDYITSKIMQYDLNDNKKLSLQIESKNIITLNENFLSNLMKKFKKKKNVKPDSEKSKLSHNQSIDPNLAPTIPVTYNSQSMNTAPSGPPSFQSSPAPQVKNNQTNKKSHPTLRTNRDDALSEVNKNDILQILTNLKLLTKHCFEKFEEIASKEDVLSAELNSSGYGDSIKTYLDNIDRIFIMLFQPKGYYEIIKKT